MSDREAFRRSAGILVSDGARAVAAEARAGETVADVIRRSRMFFSMPCGGRHTCGKCAVLVKGGFSAISEEEESLLRSLRGDSGAAAKEGWPKEGWSKEGSPKLQEGWRKRMACLCLVTGPGEVLLPGNGRAAEAGPGLLGEAALRYDGDGGFLPGSFGIAVDIGTTTISALLFRFGGGETAASAHEMNRQTAYGADVVSRIGYAAKHGAAEPGACLVTQLRGMVSELTGLAERAGGRVTRISAAGNTTMLHFLTGLDPSGMGSAPFAPQSLFGVTRPAREIFPDADEGAELYIPPSISAYVGADITCGIFAAGLSVPDEPGEPEKARLLVDVGTNGEMALFHGGRLTCCSAAAGPAFEGAEIAMGMAALPGAVCKIVMRNGAVECLTVGGAKPAGICGSGLVSAVRVMLDWGVLDGTGRILDSGHDLAGLVERRDGQPVFWLGGSGVCVTQKDIRAVQLAKASIAAGIETLLREAGLTPDGVERLFLSGGFGSSIDAAEAAAIGLFPAALLGRTVQAGNTSLAGAAMALFSKRSREKIRALADAAEEIPLSASHFFMEEYVRQMSF